MLKQIFDAGITPDYAVIFEDMCYNNGLLVSPKFVREHMLLGWLWDWFCLWTRSCR